MRMLWRGALCGSAVVLSSLSPVSSSSPVPLASSPSREPVAAASPAPAAAVPGSRQRLLETVGQVPLHFERNDGQADAAFDFVAHGAGYRVGIAPAGTTLVLASGRDGATGAALDPVAFQFAWRGATPSREPVAFDRQAATVNYVRGNDPTQWRQGVPTFARVRYDEVYPGIALVYYGNLRRLQYDFVVAPGADPSAIALDVHGADRVELAGDGRLLLHAGGRTLEQQAPFTYQMVDGRQQEVPSRFVLDRETVRFEVGAYDTSRELVIDPVIAYSSWFGGSGEEGILDMAVDALGNLVVFGFTLDSQATLQFPTTPGAIKPTRGSDSDAFVTKFSPNGSTLLFSTLIGGSGDEMVAAYNYDGGLALDAAGNVYITGTTRSADFPVTPTGFDIDYNDDDPGATGNQDGFFMRLSPTGIPLYGTYLGGRRIDEPHDIDVDAAGNVYIVGSTDSNETTGPNGGFVIAGDAFDPTHNGSSDIFLLRFNALGALTYSTYLGGTSGDGNGATAVRASRTTPNVVYVAGDSSSSTFPTTAGTRLQGFVSGPDAVLVRLDLSLPAANQLTYGTFFGGNGTELITAMALDASDNVYLAGATNSSAASFPAAVTAPGSPAPSGTDVLVAKFDTAASGAASLVYGMRINGAFTDTATDIALDAQNQAWVGVDGGSFAPATSPNDFPLKNTLTTARSGNGVHQAVVQVNAAGNDLILSSLIGGNSGRGGPVAVAVNAAGEVWVGATSGGGTDRLDVVSPFQSGYGGGDADATLQRIGPRADLSITKTVDKPYPQTTVLPGDTLIYTIVVSNPTGDSAANVVVTDPLPAQVTFVSCTATGGGICGGSGNARTVTFPVLASGQTAQITLVTRVNDNVGPNTVWTNTATIGASSVVDPDTTNNTGGGGGDRGNGSGGVAPITDPAADADNDGLPNGWEQQFGLNPLSNSPDNGANGDPDGDGKTNLQEYQEGTHPRGFVITYLAEGATGDFFSTRLAIANPTTTQALVLTRFQKSDGTTVPHYQVVPPLSRATVDVGTLAGLNPAEFATLVEADVQVVVDRTMTWPVSGASPGYGAHAERGILTRTATTWYLAEGSTAGNFDLFYLIQNPSETDANIEVTYLLPSGPPVVRTYRADKQSRFNIWVNQQGPPLDATDVSAVIRSTNGVPVIVERAMYLTAPGQLYAAGHESAGVTSPATDWFLAEGATGPFFDLFILIANPNAQAATIEARYLLPSGQVITKTYVAGANSRSNIWVDYEGAALADTAVSTTVRSTNGVPIIVERAMWWPGPSPANWYEAHNSPGSTETGVKWAMAEGEAGGSSAAETYILIANTSGTAGNARVTLLFEDGTPPASLEYALPPSSRTNVPVSFDFPGSAGKRFGAIVESLGAAPAPIVVERAVYYNAGGRFWAAGTNALATKLQ